MTELRELEQIRLDIESALKSCIPDDGSPLYPILAYELGWVDEVGMPLSWPQHSRNLAMLCLLACRALGRDYRLALPAATAVELVHHFSRIHGDVQVGSPDRDGRATVWWVWGPAQAINAGDALHAIARLALFRLKDHSYNSEAVVQAMGMLDRAALRLCEGQHLDLVYQERLEVSEKSYWDMAQGKAGSLMECVMALGSLVGGGDSSMVTSMGEIGRKLGLALLVRSELRDLWPEERAKTTMPNGLLNKTKTLPLVHAFSQVPISKKRELGRYFFQRVLQPQDIGELAASLEECGSRRYAEDVCEHLLQEALTDLENLGIAPRETELIRGVIESLFDSASE